MAPAKFGLFKARSRDQEQPSTENLLNSSHSNDIVAPGSSIPSTSNGKAEQLSPADFTALQIGSDYEDIPSEKFTPTRRVSDSSFGEAQVNYQSLKNQTSTDATSTTTLQDEDSDQRTLAEDDGASTSCDANSLQFDVTSLAASEDPSVYCGTLKKPKKNKYKEEKQKRDDLVMWQASNTEVMQNLLSKSGTIHEQIKWEAIATARGLCTLTDSCTCKECKRTKYLAMVTDGDGGIGGAPVYDVGCNVQ